jgi:hypothetical protein
MLRPQPQAKVIHISSTLLLFFGSKR